MPPLIWENGNFASSFACGCTNSSWEMAQKQWQSNTKTITVDFMRLSWFDNWANGDG
jgi:hypothetical protein